MKTFEYKVITFVGDKMGHVNWLNSEGSNDWEVVAHHPYFSDPNEVSYLFKREK